MSFMNKVFEEKINELENKLINLDQANGLFKNEYDKLQLYCDDLEKELTILRAKEEEIEAELKKTLDNVDSMLEFNENTELLVLELQKELNELNNKNSNYYEKLEKLNQFLSLVDTDSGLKYTESPSLMTGYASCIRDLKEWLK